MYHEKMKFYNEIASNILHEVSKPLAFIYVKSIKASSYLHNKGEEMKQIILLKMWI